MGVAGSSKNVTFGLASALNAQVPVSVTLVGRWQLEVTQKASGPGAPGAPGAPSGPFSPLQTYFVVAGSPETWTVVLSSVQPPSPGAPWPRTTDLPAAPEVPLVPGSPLAPFSPLVPLVPLVPAAPAGPVPWKLLAIALTSFFCLALSPPPAA